MDRSHVRPTRFRFAVLCVAQFMLILDVVVVNVALPSIQRDLSIARSRLALVGVAYTLTFGALLVVFGRAGDVFGRRQIFLAGVGIFGLASLATGVAQNDWMLFGGRTAQGVGAAMVSPTALALVLATFPQGSARNWALGVWGAVGSAGAIAGQVIGGTLVWAFGWRAIFLVNIPVAIGIAASSARVFADSPDPAQGGKLDLGGGVLLAAAMATFTLSLVRVAEHGIDLAAGLTVAVSACLLAGLRRVEGRHPAPILDPTLVSVPSVRLGNLLLLLNAGVTTAALFFTTLYLQNVLGMSPMAVGMAFAPVSVLVLVVSPLAGKLVSRLGVRPLLATGAAAGTAGLVYLSRVPAEGAYVSDVLPGLLLLALMGGLSYAPTFLVGTAGTSPSQRGLTSGLLSTSQEVGSAMGLAVLSSAAFLVPGGATDAYRTGYLAAAATCLGLLLLSTRAPTTLGADPPADNATAEPVEIGGSR